MYFCVCYVTYAYFLLELSNIACKKGNGILYAMQSYHCFLENKWKRHEERALSMVLVCFYHTHTQLKIAFRNKTFIGRHWLYGGEVCTPWYMYRYRYLRFYFPFPSVFEYGVIRTFHCLILDTQGKKYIYKFHSCCLGRYFISLSFTMNWSEILQNGNVSSCTLDQSTLPWDKTKFHYYAHGSNKISSYCCP